MKKIDQCRGKIDDIDRKIVELLNKRAREAIDIGKLKSKSGKAVYDPTREEAILEKLRKVNKLLPDSSLKAIFTEIISASRSLESRPVISYLGPEGTFTHEAALSQFGASCDYSPASGWEAVFENVEKGLANFGVLPIENSIEGSVNLSLDLLSESSLHICAEKTIAANQNLLSNAGKISSIKKIYSHPQPLAQCRRYLAKNLHGVKVVETSSTAEAAKMAGKSKTTAAIAGLSAARIYSLNVLAQNVQDFSNNMTRFMVLSKSDAKRSPKVRYKTSTAITLNNKPGTLHSLLSIFHKRKINLTKIASRPIPRSAWSYLFYIDFEGHRKDKKVESALEEAKKNSEGLRVFGSYPIES